ncbi:MAG: hemerythrin domain-containing protein [Thaumarchaeota archaeon]|nr:hemerythrin domain-containing protein [Nitrososphaerota archaeon]
MDASDIDIVRMFRAELAQLQVKLLDMGDAVEQERLRDAINTLEDASVILNSHLKFEEALFPKLKPYLGSYMDQATEEHDEAKKAVKRLKDIISDENQTQETRVEAVWWNLRWLIDHTTNCDCLALMMEKLSGDELHQLRQKFKEAKQANPPLLKKSARAKQSNLT